MHFPRYPVIPKAVCDAPVILKKAAMKGEQQCDGVIGNVLRPVVRNIANFDSKTSACGNIDDVEAQHLFV